MSDTELNRTQSQIETFKAADLKEREQNALGWVRDMLKNAEKPVNVPNGDFAAVLKDGIILCKLMENLVGAKIGPYNKKCRGNFQMMENGAAFQESARAYGLPDRELFQPVDLVDKRNIAQVVICILALQRKAQMHPDYKGPMMGPKEATENKREFTEEQMREAEYTPRAW